MTVGERIRQRRIELGMSQSDLAKKMGYSGKSSVCKAETYGNDVTTSKVRKFADALGVTSAYLMGWEDEYIEIEKTVDNFDAMQKRMETYFELVSDKKLVDKILKLSAEQKQLIESMVDQMLK